MRIKYVLNKVKYTKREREMNKIFLYVITTIFTLMIGYIAYQQYNFYRQMSSIQLQLNQSQKALADYQEKNYKSQTLILSTIQQSNDKLSKDLENNINEVKNIDITNTDKLNRLHKTTNSIATNSDKYSKATTEAYLQTTTLLFNESTDLLREIARDADEANARALAYYTMLDNQYNIVQEYNIESAKK